MTAMSVQFLIALSVLVGALVQGLKSGAVQSVVTALCGAPIPKRALPWIALGLGVAGSVVEGLRQGAEPSAPIILGLVLDGLMAGGFAVAGAETVAKVPGAGKAPPVLALLALLGGSLIACGPRQHPCVDAYELAKTEEEIREVDRTCGHMLLGGGGQGGGK